ncbi:MAG: DUF2203 domain-containing protein [Longimicrobiales bacterium]
MSDPRRFSLEEANRTLPLVRRVIDDIVTAYGSLQARVEEYNDLAQGTTEDPATAGRAAALRDELEAGAREIDEFLRELEQIGCQLKGFDEGLVDFHAEWRDRPILLCWKLGERRIEWWHELDAGFAGRQPITPAMALELSGAGAE